MIMTTPVYTLSDSSSGSPLAANGENLTAASAVQENPVGITKKSIYVIRNTINEKVYVGQSIDPARRFTEHIQESRQNRRHTAICGAIRKYGEDNFYFEILEHDVENYNEREKYWIAFFNSIAPNGYNILAGGEDPPVRRGFANNKCKFTESDVQEIYELLKTDNITLKEIASYYGVSFRAISSINRGKTFRNESIRYPIRSEQLKGDRSKMLSPVDISAIIYAIKHSSKSLRQIAIELGINHAQVRAVNEGSCSAYVVKGETYPIRKSELFPSAEVVENIKRQLLSGRGTKHSIAADNDVSYVVVTNINSGRSYYDKNISYPIREDEFKHHIPIDVLEGICSDLSGKIAVKKIAAKYDVPASLVYDINSGKSHRIEGYTYPIRVWEPKIPMDVVIAMTYDIAHTKMSLTEIGKKYGYTKSTALCIKNGQSKQYRLPEYTYPLRPNGRCK